MSGQTELQLGTAAGLDRFMAAYRERRALDRLEYSEAEAALNAKDERKNEALIADRDPAD